MADGLAGGIHLGPGTFEFGYYGIECARHIGTGITIGNWVHIEPIDTRSMGAHGVAEGNDGLADLSGTQKL
jgi:hypothetical protein